jgi:very-short-patch-repair endonuclease
MSDRDLRHPGVERMSRDTYLPRALAGDFSARLAAVLLNAPPGAVVSHHSAAALWGLDLPLHTADTRVHLTVPTGAAVRNRADRCFHRTHVVVGETTRHEGMEVTTPARTWRDLAGVVEPPVLLAVTDQLLQALCGVSDLEHQMARRPSGRGAGRARMVLPVADPRAGSPMESVLRWLIHEAALPKPVLQYVVTDAAGRFLARADFAWPEHRLLVEFDGDVHRERGVFVNDLRRQNQLIAEAWKVLRFSSADLYGRPAEVIAEIGNGIRR